MNCLCAKFGDFGFSRFGFIVRTESQNHRQTDRQTDRITQRYTHTTTVGESNNSNVQNTAEVGCNLQHRAGAQSLNLLQQGLVFLRYLK